jgi:hypothetical protein
MNDELIPGASEMALSKDDWGTIYRMLDEFGPMVGILQCADQSAPSLRAFTRWFFSFLDTLTYAFKRIASAYASRKGIQLSSRENEVLGIVSEPRFPGMPPPRRREVAFRESLAVAILVYSRARGVSPPLHEGKLSAEFIAATNVFDRISRPSDGTELSVTRQDFLTIGKLVIWFRDFQQWMHAQRLAEIDEIREEVAESIANTRRRIEANMKDAGGDESR